MTDRRISSGLISLKNIGEACASPMFFGLMMIIIEPDNPPLHLARSSRKGSSL